MFLKTNYWQTQKISLQPHEKNKFLNYGFFIVVQKTYA